MSKLTESFCKDEFIQEHILTATSYIILIYRCFLDVYWKHISGSEPLQNVRHVWVRHGEKIRGPNFRNITTVSALIIDVNYFIRNDKLFYANEQKIY